MDTNRQITLTIPDLVVGIQETMLVLRHGRQDEDEGGHGELRRELYRFMSSRLAERELDFQIVVVASGVECTIQSKRLYHHEGCVYRVCYLTENIQSIFKDGQAKPADVGVTQIAAWAASRVFATSPKQICIIYHRVSDDPAAGEPILESKPLFFDLMEPAVIEKHIQERIGELSKHWNTPDMELPTCTDEERFAIKSDPYCKCRASCRVRDFCQQYASVRMKDSEKFQSAKSVLAAI